jgi:hypothetical protein
MSEVWELAQEILKLTTFSWIAVCCIQCAMFQACEGDFQRQTTNYYLHDFRLHM